MYFDLTDEQQAIKSTAHDFLAARYKSERNPTAPRPCRAPLLGQRQAGPAELGHLLPVGLLEAGSVSASSRIRSDL